MTSNTSISRVLGGAAATLFLMTGAAFAQTDQPGTLYDASGTATTTGVPNTGGGGNAAANLALLGGSALAFVAAAYAARRMNV